MRVALADYTSGSQASLDPQYLAFIRDFKVLYRRAEERRADLEARTLELEAALAELRESYRQTARALALMVEFKDETTGTHLDRTRRIALALAARVAPELAVNPALEYGFLLHDVGKAGIDPAILTKPGPLTPEEQEQMRLHPIIGVEFVAGIKHLQGAIPIIRQHHERWDGGGYPYGLRGEQIHLGARIFAVVDSFDAMTSDRPYRAAMPVERALEQIAAGAGTQFDPEIVRAFEDLVPDIAPTDAALSPA